MEPIINYYSKFDEWGRLDREPVEFIINWQWIQSLLPPAGHILDNGAGPGKYAMELARCGYDVTLTDLTPRLVEVAVEKAGELGLTERFRGFHTADARQLELFSNEMFDASLMLGPLYHLQSEMDRAAAVQELHRVTKSGGLVFVAFMSRIRHLTTSLLYPQHWRPNDNMEDISTFVETGIFNHKDDGRFTGAYYFNIDDIEPYMASNGFERIKLIGSSSIAGSFKSEQFDYWRSKGEEEYHKVMELLHVMSEDRHMLGASSHLLYIGRRT